jgi:hypothetical protein
MLKVEKTEIGFEIVYFKDRYETPCSLQQSSLAEYEPPGTSAVWFGIHPDPSRYEPGEIKIMHLDRMMVEEIIELLQRWLETGSFKKGRQPDDT